MDQIYKNYTTIFLFLLICAILVTLDRLGSLALIHKVATPFLEQAQIPAYVIQKSLTDRIHFLITLQNISRENEILSQKLAQSEAENVKLANLEIENEALKVQLGFFGSQIKSTPAKILGMSRFLVVLPAGKGFKAGTAVTLGNNFVGSVAEVGAKLVKVKIPVDPSSSIPAVIRTPTGAVYGTVVGRYGKTMILDKVEKQEIVPEGAIVQTAGDDNILPGLVLGKVARVEKTGTDPFLAIEVESLVDLSKLTTVFILGE